jgi:hypothetical protein
MCGIHGMVAGPSTRLSPKRLRRAVDRLFILSETRGREAAGIALHDGQRVHVLKQPVSASQMIRGTSYDALWDAALGPDPGDRLTRPVSLIGHSRLVTNGRQTMHANNQPVVGQRATAVHNGILVNVDTVFADQPDLPRAAEVDTELIVRLIDRALAAGRPIADALHEVFTTIEGAASIGLVLHDQTGLTVATNTGSLYLCHQPDSGLCCFGSEQYIVEQFRADDAVSDTLTDAPIVQLHPGQWATLTPDGHTIHDLSSAAPPKPTPSGVGAPPEADAEAQPKRLVPTPRDHSSQIDPKDADLRRCTRCILPHTIPFIRFDDDGVCSYCHSLTYDPLPGREALLEKLAPYRRDDGGPDCLVGVSGGRDSCYGLHVLKAELGLNPIAYTYDWGMVTDLARRNTARMCGKLGVEHIIVSADIRTKRRHIKRNIEAWLGKPDLGMIPLFMAGDKQFFYHANRLIEQTGIKLMVFCENIRYEQTRFKAGFCGIDEANRRLYDLSLAEKAKLASYYGRQYLTNPAYLNRSLADSVGAFFSAYGLTHDYLYLFQHLPWDEATVDRTLIDTYDWELADDTPSTWRIGDGTAPFYNYIYHTVTGFTEFDTFRSNQIRDGVMDRDRALELVAKENHPRWPSMQWYANTVGFDLDEALRVIHAMPRLYSPKPEAH